MPSKSGSKLNIKQCQLLIANNFMSTDCKRDYQHEEVIDRLLELQARKDERAIKDALRAYEKYDDELPPPIPIEADEGLDAQFDWMKRVNLLPLNF